MMSDTYAWGWLLDLWSESKGNPLRQHAIAVLIAVASVAGFNRITTNDLQHLPPE